MTNILFLVSSTEDLGVEPFCFYLCFLLLPRRKWIIFWWSERRVERVCVWDCNTCVSLHKHMCNQSSIEEKQTHGVQPKVHKRQSNWRSTGHRRSPSLLIPPSWVLVRVELEIPLGIIKYFWWETPSSNHYLHLRYLEFPFLAKKKKKYWIFTYFQMGKLKFRDIVACLRQASTKSWATNRIA